MSFTYSQPDFYHFNEDSLNLVSFINGLGLPEKLTFMEFGGGCGVISIELAGKNPLWQGQVIELQNEFLSHLRTNILSSNSLLLSPQIADVQELDGKEAFDLVFFNPPYFVENEGRPSKNLQRHRCRHIDSNDFVMWLSKASSCLKTGGVVAFCLPSSSKLCQTVRKFPLEIRKEEVIGKIIYFYLVK